MSEFSEQKRHFKLALVQGMPAVAPNPAKAQKWEREFKDVLSLASFPKSPRLVNNFSLGADPEFVFEDPYYGARIDATNIGLKTGLAFGADQNGRLVELRPTPSKFALEVLASILVELRWLAAMHPETFNYYWRAGAFVFKDGLGGHVHIGSKHKEKDIRTRIQLAQREDNDKLGPELLHKLDILVAMLIKLGCFPERECAARIAGDAKGQFYGRDSDIRFQNHGFEYRTFPTWLDSPWLGYLVLVLSKLVTFDPSLIANTSTEAIQAASPKWLEERIVNLLAYYQGMDDDARIAYSVYKQIGLPKFMGGDFKTRWGIVQYPLVTGLYLPDSIQPTDADVQELWAHLVKYAPLTGKPVCNWKKLPEGYKHLLDTTATTGIKNWGELLQGLCIHRDMLGLVLTPVNGRGGVRISKKFATRLPQHWQQLVPTVTVGCNSDIEIGLNAREPAQLKETRRILLSGAFPFWDIKDVGFMSYSLWKATPRDKQGEEFKTKLVMEL